MTPGMAFLAFVVTLVTIIGYIFIAIAAYDYMLHKLNWGSYDNIGICLGSMFWPFFLLYWLLVGWPLMGVFWLYRAMTKPAKIKKARARRSGAPQEVK